MNRDAASAVETSQNRPPGGPGRWDFPPLLVGIATAIAAIAILTSRQKVNWDEFNYLTQVHAFLRGDLAGRFQTLHVHLFAWLTHLDGNEIDQIVAGRLVMAACMAGSAALVYAIARRFAGREAALFGLLAYLSLTVVAEHGASFRADPLATVLSLLAVWLLLAVPARLLGAALAGVAMAVAIMVTVKAVFYVATIGAALLCLAPGWRGFLRQGFAFGIAVAIVATALFVLHGAALAPSRTVTAAVAGSGALELVWQFAARAAEKMFVEDGIFPRWREFLIVVALNPLFWIMTVDGTATALGAARRGTRADWLPLALALPVLTPVFYRNAFFYYFVFILPPAAILIALSCEKHRARLLARTDRAGRLMAASVVAALLLFMAVNYARLLPDRTAPQRATLAGVHQVFLQPVRYIDGFGAIASFPRAGFFMSGWGMDSYRAAGRPVFPDLVAAAQPPMLLADAPSLYAALVSGFEVAEDRRLLPEDAQFLANHYQQYWGMLFVAGKRFAVPAGGAGAEFAIAVAGDYRLEATLPVRIDGRDLMPGDVVKLAVGPHRFEAEAPEDGRDADVRLLWAAARPAPDTPPVDLLTFFGVGDARP